MKKLSLIKVASSNIAAIGYLGLKRSMYVRFKSGELYEYEQIPELVYRDFLNAESKGSYLRDHVRDRYQFRKVDELPDDPFSTSVLFPAEYSLAGIASFGGWF